MEIKKIRNDALVQAYQTMHANNTKEHQDAVTRQMVHATFLLPVIPVKGKLPEDFPPKVLKDPNGKTFLPVFTDMDQARAGIKGIADALIPIDISDAYAYLVDNKELQGVIVNAFAKPNLICPRPMVEALAKLWSRIKTAELNGENPEEALKPKPQNIKLLVPKEYPDGVTFTLSSALKGQGDIEKAWMCMVQKSENDRPEERDWMVILQAELPLKGREEVFREIGKTLAPFIGQRNVIFAENNPNLAGLTNQAQPIYTREEADI